MPDWNAKIAPDDVCDDTLEKDESVTEVIDLWKYSAFLAGQHTQGQRGGSHQIWSPVKGKEFLLSKQINSIIFG